MDPRRSKKSRSIANEPKSAKATPASARPALADRTHSDPAVARRRTSQTQSYGQGQGQRIADVRVSDVRISDVIDRDSQTSITDDPFFRPYQSSHSTCLAAESRLGHGIVARNEDPSKNANLPQVNVVVLGSRRVGKSTFIQRALDLRESPPRAWSSKRMSLDGVIYIVRLCELMINDITITDSTKITWPKLLSEEGPPSIDGILVLYDVTNEESVIEIPHVLYALDRSGGGSVVLVSCKEDHPPQLRRVNPDFNERIKSCFSKLETCSTSTNVPESQKRCISIILRSILRCKRGAGITSSLTNPYGKAAISPNNTLPSKGQQPPGRVQAHFPMTSTLPTTDFNDTLNPLGQKLDEPTTFHKLIVDVPASQSAPPKVLHSQPPTFVADLSRFPDDSDSASGNQDSDNPSSPDSPHKTGILRPDTANSQTHNTFLDMEEEESQDDSMNCHSPPSVTMETPGASDPARDETGSSFDELIDRLLSLPMSKQDGKFVPVFLCLYRKFASPGQVFTAITNRFSRVEHSNDAQLVRLAEQLRYLQVLALWTGDYPGDFAAPSIKKDAISFVSRLERSRFFAYAAKEISNHLELASEDDDADWGPFDSLDALPDANASFHSQSEATSPSIRTGDSSTEELLKPSRQSSLEGSYDDSTWKSGVPPVGSSVVISSNMSNMSSQSPVALLTRDETRQEAQNLVSIPRTRLSKLQWHQFVEIPDEDIAKELTRIDWIFYSSIRPRDLVRHVTLASDANKTTKRLDNVNRMIDHFNRLFCFVSGMILLRDKPKHRARMLEKWMTVAWKVRQLNNYNTLGAIIAGTNGTAVHRLTSTWELVPEQIRKDYMRLTILMGSMRSHGAYRMAWDNSFSERIPFIPVYRKDLVAAETGNRTFIGPQGNRINWKKFEIMGEVIISMQRSQGKPYKVRRNEEVLRLVLETQISQGDEDLAEELYERSLQVEPTGTGDTSRKKFDWLRR
ncbi:hypothetical protein GJ744_003142 [Endocarpon pusillum]|uniref:Ras-GEF domain-containing protein n=1 Tax=Endocarpon pusillum TaxID=364733 RepID=A0A8H7AQX3_9EURO|nr:hypothetical protein GJ744_003142 [Endocarpon pusillum]